jgi:hypothetical protein
MFAIMGDIKISLNEELSKKIEQIFIQVKKGNEI